MVKTSAKSTSTAPLIRENALITGDRPEVKTDNDEKSSPGQLLAKTRT